MLRRVLSVSLTILCCALGAVAGPTPTPAPVDALAPADLQRALDFVRKNYVAPAAVDQTALDRATLAGLLDRLGAGAVLITRNANAEPSPAPLFKEIIDGHVGYLRPGGLRRSDLGELDEALRNFAGKKVDALILDLRAGGAATDFALAAEFAQRFVPRTAELFTLHGPAAGPDRSFTSERSPGYVGFMSVLIDSETVGAAEVLASVLRARDKAILIGSPTGGAAFAYSELPLPGGYVLRVASAEAVLPEQNAALPHPVEPDIPVPLPLPIKHEIFSQSLTKSMAAFVFEEDRPHLNEAALLAGTNPEIEAMQERQQRRARGESPPLHDAVVQRAMDVITSIGVYAKPAGTKP